MTGQKKKQKVLFSTISLFTSILFLFIELNYNREDESFLNSILFHDINLFKLAIITLTLLMTVFVFTSKLKGILIIQVLYLILWLSVLFYLMFTFPFFLQSFTPSSIPFIIFMFLSFVIYYRGNLTSNGNG